MRRQQRFTQGLIVGAVVVGIVLALLALRLFASAQLSMTNLYFVPAPVSEDIALVALDDASVQQYGRSPAEWERTVYADLVKRLGDAKARVVAFDLLFDTETPLDSEFASAIQTARNSDARTRTVLADVGVQVSSAISGGSNAIHFDNTLDPTLTLFNAVDYTGFVNTYPDIDGVIRRQPTLIDAHGDRHLSFSLAIYSAFLRIPSAAISQVIVSQGSTLQIAGQHTIPVDAFGLWMQNFFGPASNRVRSTFPIVSLRDVLTGSVDPATFADKIVLIGVMNNASASDQFPVPSDSTGRLMSGVELHANAVETLIQGRFLQDQTPLSQVTMIVLLGLVASLIYAQLPWFLTFPSAIILLLGWFAFAFATFSTQQIVVNLFHSSLAIALPLLGNLGLSISAEIQRRQKSEFLLETVVEVSSQQLALDKILPRIASDVQRVLNASDCEIWLVDENSPIPQRAYATATPSTLEAISKRALAEKHPLAIDHQIAAPILWQGNLLGVVAAQIPVRFRQHGKLRLLEELLRQIAPDLENTLLYTALKQQNTLVEAIFAGSPAAILLLSDQLVLLRHNGELGKILAHEDFADEDIFALFGDATFSEDVRQKLRAKFQASAQFRHEMPVGSKTYTLDAAPIEAYRQWVVVLTDISTLAELSQLKTRLIRMASHDLRNPLSSIMGYSSLMLENSTGINTLSSRNREFMEHIQHAGEIMKQIITDILSLEQLRTGVIQTEPVDLRALVQHVMSQQERDFAAKHQTLSAQLPASVPPIQANSAHLTQAIINLVNNASKYTPDGGYVSIRLYPPDEQHLRLEVQDTGYGIPEEAQAKLFSEFYRVRTADTENIQGTGLGLSLVKSVIEGHHGRVWVQSKQGVGSTFFVELPVDSST